MQFLSPFTTCVVCQCLGCYLVAWNPIFPNLRDFKTCAGLLIKGKLKGYSSMVHLLNIYGPYSQRRYFWDRILLLGLLSLPQLILDGDMNFT